MSNKYNLSTGLQTISIKSQAKEKNILNEYDIYLYNLIYYYQWKFL